MRSNMAAFSPRSYKCSGAAAAEAAWADIKDQLRAFDTPTGWDGPNELLLTAARRP